MISMDLEGKGRGLSRSVFDKMGGGGTPLPGMGRRRLSDWYSPCDASPTETPCEIPFRGPEDTTVSQKCRRVSAGPMRFTRKVPPVNCVRAMGEYGRVRRAKVARHGFWDVGGRDCQRKWAWLNKISGRKSGND
jgi:hypothetical protein